MLEMICKELGVEIEEIWAGNDGFRYCILSSGNIERYEDDTSNGYLTLNVTWADILNGTLKPKWQPKEGEGYYTPFITIYETDRFIYKNWLGDDRDNWYFENNMAFKTEKEAIEATNRLIELYKEDR